MSHETDFDRNWNFVESDEDLLRAAETLAAGEGPVGIDAERASGYRYFSDAYLVQVSRRHAGTYIFDPKTITDFEPLAQAIQNQEWILHAASQDLACLADIGLVPDQIFDTELAARLLGFERVSLGAVIEELLGITLEKAYSAADWSTRPLPQNWLDYAAYDVTLLPDLRDSIADHLLAQNKEEIAHQEFEAVLEKKPKEPHPEPWRRVSGLGAVKDRIGLSVARELWLARDAYAREQDTAPGRLLPDSSILAVAKDIPRSADDLARNKNFRGRASRTQLNRWWKAVRAGKMSQDQPSLRGVPTTTVPHHRSWTKKSPEAATRLGTAREQLAAEAERLAIPLENLLTPSLLRELSWDPPSTFDPDAISHALEKLGARPWQRDATAQIIAAAFVDSQ